MSAPRPFGIDFPVVPTTAMGHVLQAMELMRAAGLVARLRLGRGAPRLGWRLCDAKGQALPVTAGPVQALLDEGRFDGPAQAQWVLSQHAPDVPTLRQAVQRQRALLQHMAVVLDQGQRVLTLGNGAWLAAGSGRLAQRRVALPWYWAAAFHRDHPDIQVADGTGVCVDGPWLSAALPCDIGELLLALLAQLWDRPLHDAMASVLRPDAARQKAALEALDTQHVPTTRDSALAKAIKYLEQHVEQPYSLDAVSRAASVSARTLLRHFQEALGHSPLDHLHRLRCDRARLLLEITLQSIPAIAQSCGYADPAAFRRVFSRHVGLTPQDYRDGHTLRAPRKRWRVAV
ncbi:MAG: helix-turn-helix domain-containing protein [Burkholderiaceae bacterium]|nr:helix-turn-helix domain-containing protein [Burkholderiaceae bacterium]